MNLMGLFRSPQIEIIRDKRFKDGDYYTDFMRHFEQER